MSINAYKGSSEPFIFRYETCRNISTNLDKGSGRRIFCGYAPVTSFVNIPDDANVREYLPTAEGKQRHVKTAVHHAIYETLAERPDAFPVMNGGITIVAHRAEVRDAVQERWIEIDTPNIVNGSQTQGEIKEFLKKQEGEEQHEGDSVPYCFFQLLVLDSDKSQGIIADIAIARNTQNKVHPISIAGRQGELEELRDVFRKGFGKELRKSESDFGDFVDTEKLVQVILALMPDKLSDHKGAKTYTYSAKAKCFKKFRSYYDGRQGQHRERYQFFLDHAVLAWELYTNWKCMDLKGTGLHTGKGKAYYVGSDNTSQVADGLVFPTIAALSGFFRKSGDKWEYEVPSTFSDREFLVKDVKPAYVAGATSDPQKMGKSAACYERLARSVELMSARV